MKEPGRKSRSARWAATLYAAADNDLSPHAVRDLDDIGRAGTPLPMFIGFELDSRGSQGTLRYEFMRGVAPDGPRLRAVVERLLEQNSGDPLTLRNHLDWAARRAGAATHWLVVVWGHGIGRRVAPDELSAGGALDMPRLREAFVQAGFGRAAEARMPVEGIWAEGTRGQISILGFDACLMGTIENIAALHDVADIVVASQEIVPARGWPYARILRPEQEVAARGLDPWDVARHIVDAYAAHHGERGVTDVVLSAVSTDFAVELMGRVGTLGRALAEALDSRRGATIRAAVLEARDLAQPFFLIDYVDLADFCHWLGETLAAYPREAGEVRAAAEAVAGRIEKAGPQELHCAKPRLKNGRNSPAVRWASGLSVWLPAQRELFYSHRATYQAAVEGLTDASARDGWPAFLTALHRAPRG